MKTQQFYNLGSLPEWDNPIEIVIVTSLSPIQPEAEAAYYLPRKIENQFEVVLDCLDAVEHGEHIGARAIADEVRVLRGLIDDVLAKAGNCAECGEPLPPLCPSCLEWEAEKERDHRDELEAYHLVSAGVG